ncbi:MAG: T9SS type A sorting domain-containing protein, partial [Bacteroidetes bacterium]|nr:T9SS type A sorting domain-containing protein [Bacteroidota bacterium]
MNNFLKFLFFVVLALNISLLSQTTLTVTEGAATLDGVISLSEYTSIPLVTQLGVTLYAMDDGEYFYFAATWEDDTESIAKKQWFYDGTTWTQSENEDRFGIIFDMGLNDPDGASCATMCHGDGLMRTNNGYVDVWHWKAYRSNPMGVADDKRWETDDRHSDPGTSSYSNNGPDANDLPEFMAVSDPGANVNWLVNSASLGNFDPYSVISSTFAEAITFDQGAAFSNGDEIPGYVLRNADGDRGNVMAAGKWDNGAWTVEFKRVNSGTDYDFAVLSGGSVDFTYEIFDNTGSGHPNDGFDVTVYTLDFSNIIVSVDEQTGEQLPETYSLAQNYPNPFNPSTTIEYSLPEQANVTIAIYDVLGNELEVLFSGNKSSGTHRLNWNASNYSSGIYFY